MPRREEEVQRVAEGRGYWREDDARVVVEAWRASEISVAAFARRYGLSPRRITRWAKRLDEDSSAVRFHPVRVVTSTAMPTPLGDSPSIEIVLEGGLRVRVPAGVDPSELRQVLDVVVEHSRC